MEYPIAVRIAPINVWSISNEKVTKPHNNEYAPMIMIVSLVSATTEPTL